MKFKDRFNAEYNSSDPLTTLTYLASDVIDVLQAAEPYYGKPVFSYALN